MAVLDGISSVYSKRYKAERYPSMLIRVPSGVVNLYTFCGILFSSKQRIVTGRVAADEAEPQAVIQAGECFSQKENGFSLVKAKYMIGRMMKR